ncbi:NB-ARC domain-containing protein [Saccharothrix sp.]|uniref:NB-ARC domain-containing protein n=1 Tax=Saccharothrix sp. TaxID=1873460 RepID=UPI0028122893|nr:NB-ARC domain-containing protein [Saccharothrix sp.]
MHFYGGHRGRRDPPRQLPADVRGFVNRVDDLDRLDRLLGDGSGPERSLALCILVGTAGVGKTSLAVHWAHRVVDRFPDGQLYVNLHGYDPGPPVTPHQALERFLGALQVPAESIPADPEARAAAYRSLLADRRILVVLDNASSVAQVRPLLPGTAGCLVLITSRSRLSGLVARDGAHRVSLGVLSEEQSIELLQGVTAGYRPPGRPGRAAGTGGTVRTAAAGAVHRRGTRGQPPPHAAARADRGTARRVDAVGRAHRRR